METERKQKVIGVRVTANQHRQIQELIKDRNITTSTLGRVLFEQFIRREVRS